MKEKKYENERGMIPLERYYQPEIETASREQIKAWQAERLVKQVQHVWDNVPYYRKKMEETNEAHGAVSQTRIPDSVLQISRTRLVTSTPE